MRVEKGGKSLGRAMVALLLLWAAPAVAAAPGASGRIEAVISGPAAQLPGLWGASSPGGSMAIAPDLAVVQTTPAPVSLPLPSEADPPARDRVSAVEVQAAPVVRGPAWWKVSDGDSVVWIMGTPDRMPLPAAFDDKALGQRIAAANQVILPAAPLITGLMASAAKHGLDRGPGSPGVSLYTRGDRLSRDTPADSLLRLPESLLTDRLPPSLLARLEARIAVDRDRADHERKILMRAAAASQTVRWAPNEISATLTVAARLAELADFPGPQGNAAVDRAIALARDRRKPLTVLKSSARDIAPANNFLEAPFGQMVMGIAEPLQQACLAKVLDMLDSGVTLSDRLDMVDAWARGDVAFALKRANVMSTCDFGPAGRQFWESLVDDNVGAVVTALARPGSSVAIIEFDPLLMGGGVIDQLRAKGLAVEAPEGAP